MEERLSAVLAPYMEKRNALIPILQEVQAELGYLPDETMLAIANTERRVQLIRQAIAPVGESKPDWQITCEIAQKMGASGFEYSGPEEILAEISSVAPAYGGISFARLEKEGLQCPCPTDDHPGTKVCAVRVEKI